MGLAVAMGRIDMGSRLVVLSEEHQPCPGYTVCPEDCKLISHDQGRLSMPL